MTLWRYAFRQMEKDSPRVVHQAPDRGQSDQLIAHHAVTETLAYDLEARYCLLKFWNSLFSASLLMAGSIRTVFPAKSRVLVNNTKLLLKAQNDVDCSVHYCHPRTT